MELGRHLVRELGIENSVDTLGRWMAHHISELIEQAEKAPSDTERLIALKEATDTILKLWEHRAFLPGNAYPLAPYRNILLALDRLAPNNDPFIQSWRNTGTEGARLASSIYRRISRLLIAVLLLEEGLAPAEGLHSATPVAVEALTQEEQLVLDSIESWARLFWSDTDSTLIEVEEQDATALPEIDLSNMVLKLIDEEITELTELRSHITSQSDSL